MRLSTDLNANTVSCLSNRKSAIRVIAPKTATDKKAFLNQSIHVPEPVTSAKRITKKAISIAGPDISRRLRGLSHER